jgi:hypothetical protein
VIKYMSAEDGALILSTEIIGGKEYACRTPYQVADALRDAGGVDEAELLHSSSVDFAREYGFRTHYGAYARWNRGLEIYRKREERKSNELRL